MIYVIAGTNRKNSRTIQVAKYVLSLYKSLKVDAELVDLATLDFHEVSNTQYGDKLPESLQKVISKLDNSDGIVVVTPEYNGSMPGALKHFIDHWSYPKTFEYRPVAFVGLGFRWGGLRPVEHLQQVFNYRNAFIFPERVFITNIGDALKDEKITDKNVAELLDKQTKGFVKFVRALHSEKLHPSDK